jgi:hypothetical protein
MIAQLPAPRAQPLNSGELAVEQLHRVVVERYQQRLVGQEELLGEAERASARAD